MAGIFENRQEAGRDLAARLEHYKGKANVLVLALPRGGVPVGYEIARALGCSLDILLIRKVGCPDNPELAAGAISESGAQIINRDIVSSLGISESYLEEEIARQKEEIARRAIRYREEGGHLPREGKTVILVDDGVATGATMKTAIATLKEEKLGRLVVALPVAPPDTAREIRRTVDEWVCLETPSPFGAVGRFYRDFAQTGDEEVVDLLRRARTDES